MPSPTPTLPEALSPLSPLRLADRAHAGLVLMVDDVPDNLAVQHDALDAPGHATIAVRLEPERARA